MPRGQSMARSSPGYAVASAPHDGRARLVRMTARARSAIRHARAEEVRIEEEWRAHLGDKRMKQLREALAALREITDPYQ